MAIIVYNGLRYSVAQSETFAVPQHGSQVITYFQGIEFTFEFNPVDTPGFGVVPTVDSGRIRYVLTGFNNPVGSYFDVAVGDIAGKKMHLSALVHGVQGSTTSGQPARLVTLTFMLEV